MSKHLKPAGERRPSEAAWLKAIEERNVWRDERKKYEKMVLHAALQIGDWRAPDGYAHWAEELNRCLKELRYAMKNEESLTTNVTLAAAKLWEKTPRRKR